MARTLWHPAVIQAFENELEDDRENLAIEAEHQLTTEPLRIDVLIIKKTKNIVIKKNIGQIFRQFNIIEYKSPDDSISVENYHKTHAYARLYASLNKVDINDLSVTVATTRHPRRLLAFLRKQFAVQHMQPGIYLIEGEIYPTQILVGTELSKKDNFWLANLRNDLTAEQLEQVLDVSVDRPDTDVYVQAIINANAEVLEELRMRRTKLDTLLEKWHGDRWRAEGKAVGIAEGEAKGEAVGQRKLILAILKNRFGKVSQEIADAVHSYSDPIALESLAVRAASSKTLDEFREGL
jgi:hypothetical protein